MTEKKVRFSVLPSQHHSNPIEKDGGDCDEEKYLFGQERQKRLEQIKKEAVYFDLETSLNTLRNMCITSQHHHHSSLFLVQSAQLSYSPNKEHVSLRTFRYVQKVRISICK
jgi:hypothetical protein